MEACQTISEINKLMESSIENAPISGHTSLHSCEDLLLSIASSQAAGLFYGIVLKMNMGNSLLVLVKYFEYGYCVGFMMLVFEHR